MPACRRRSMPSARRARSLRKWAETGALRLGAVGTLGGAARLLAPMREARRVGLGVEAKPALADGGTGCSAIGGGVGARAFRQAQRDVAHAVGQGEDHLVARVEHDIGVAVIVRAVALGARCGASQAQ